MRRAETVHNLSRVVCIVGRDDLALLGVIWGSSKRVAWKLTAS